MIQNNKPTAIQFLLDKAGMWTSGLCAVHCVALPVLLSMSAFSSWAFLHDERIETTVLGVSAALALSSLVPSYLRHHRQLLPMALLLCGFVLLSLSRNDVNESLLAPAGALLLTLSHLVNYRLCRKCHLYQPSGTKESQQQ